MDNVNTEWLVRIAESIIAAQAAAEITGVSIEEIIDFGMLANDCREAVTRESVARADERGRIIADRIIAND